MKITGWSRAEFNKIWIRQPYDNDGSVSMFSIILQILLQFLLQSDRKSVGTVSLEFLFV